MERDTWCLSVWGWLIFSAVQEDTEILVDSASEAPLQGDPESQDMGKDQYGPEVER
jgi:hypothetical protein